MNEKTYVIQDLKSDKGEVEDARIVGPSSGGADVTPDSVLSALEGMDSSQQSDARAAIGAGPDAAAQLRAAFAHVAWDDDDGAVRYNALIARLYSVSIVAAVYTQSGTVYDNATLESLKSDLVVTATYADGTSETLAPANYTLSGTLAAGTSTITVTYGDKTATFDVTVTSVVLYSLTNYAFDGGSIDTGVKLFESDADWSIAVDLTLDTNPSSGDGSTFRVIRAINEDGDKYAVALYKSTAASTGYRFSYMGENVGSEIGNIGIGRLRFAITHERGSDVCKIKLRSASYNPVEAQLTHEFVASSKNAVFGQTTGASQLPKGTITKAQILAYAMSEAEVNQWCGQ